jgi:hypothetical protein
MGGTLVAAPHQVTFFSLTQYSSNKYIRRAFPPIINSSAPRLTRRQMDSCQAQKMNQTWNEVLSRECHPYDQMLQDVKEYGGSSHVPTQMPCVSLSQKENYPPNSSMLPARKKKGTPQPLSTGNFAWRSGRRSLLPQLQACLEPEFMPSSPAPKPQLTTVTRNSPEFPSLSNLEPNPFDETQEPIGMPYGPPRSPEISNLSQPMYVWLATVPCDPLGQTTQIVEECQEQFKYFGVLRARANLTVHGQKQELTLILSVPDPSSGTVIRINNMWWSMNFEGVLIEINFRNRCCALVTMDRSLPCPC